MIPGGAGRPMLPVGMSPPSMSVLGAPSSAPKLTINLGPMPSAQRPGQMQPMGPMSGVSPMSMQFDPGMQRGMQGTMTQMNAPQIQIDPVTVYVGNITPKATESFINMLLEVCVCHIAKDVATGGVLRAIMSQTCGVQFKPFVPYPESSGRLFGFAQFTNEEFALRCIRVLNCMKLDGVELIARTDKKSGDRLAEYQSRKKNEMSIVGIIKEKSKHGSIDEGELDGAARELDAKSYENAIKIIETAFGPQGQTRQQQLELQMKAEREAGLKEGDDVQKPRRRFTDAPVVTPEASEEEKEKQRERERELERETDRRRDREQREAERAFDNEKRAHEIEVTLEKQEATRIADRDRKKKNDLKERQDNVERMLLEEKASDRDRWWKDSKGRERRKKQRDREREWDEADKKRETDELEARHRAERDAIERSRMEEERRKRDQQEHARKEEEAQRIAEEAAEKARIEAENKAKREAEVQSRKEARDRAIREAEEREHRELEEKNRIEAELRAKREAEMKAIEQARLEDEKRAIEAALEAGPTKLTLSSKRPNPPARSGSLTGNVFARVSEDDNNKKRRLAEAMALRESNEGEAYAETLLDQGSALSMSMPVVTSDAAAPSTLTQEPNEDDLLRELVKTIPSTKDALLRAPVELDYLPFVEARLRTWLRKKLKELIGEGSDALLEMIMMRLKDGSSMADLLVKLTDVLEEDTDSLVMKMWRMFLFEIARFKALNPDK